jgi:hypothetical protein
MGVHFEEDGTEVAFYEVKFGVKDLLEYIEFLERFKFPAKKDIFIEKYEQMMGICLFTLKALQIQFFNPSYHLVGNDDIGSLIHSITIADTSEASMDNLMQAMELRMSKYALLQTTSKQLMELYVRLASLDDTDSSTMNHGFISRLKINLRCVLMHFEEE